MRKIHRLPGAVIKVGGGGRSKAALFRKRRSAIAESEVFVRIAGVSKMKSPSGIEQQPLAGRGRWCIGNRLRLGCGHGGQRRGREAGLQQVSSSHERSVLVRVLVEEIEDLWLYDGHDREVRSAGHFEVLRIEAVLFRSLHHVA